MIDPKMSRLPAPPQVFLNSLIIFSPKEVFITKEEALIVLSFIFYHPGVLPADLTENDIAFAQSLLVESIDASYGIGFRIKNEKIYQSEAINKLAVEFLNKTQGAYNMAAALSALLKGLITHGGIHHMVRQRLYDAHFIRWVTRVKAGTPALV